jgi:hypothetical protein
MVRSLGLAAGPVARLARARSAAKVVETEMKASQVKMNRIGRIAGVVWQMLTSILAVDDRLIS